MPMKSKTKQDKIYKVSLKNYKIILTKLNKL